MQFPDQKWAVFL